MNIAICIIAYNRVDSLKRVLSSLEKGYYPESVPLIISIDKSNTTKVEDFAKAYNWKQGEKRVVTHQDNLGLRKHVLKCGDLLNEYDALIVLEDDVSVAPSFYYYAKQCVEKYYNDDNIAGISLYNFPLNYQNQLPFYPLHSDSDVYLMQCAQSWGQVWMKKQWLDFKEWYLTHNEEFEELPHLPKAICNWPKSSWLKYHIKYCIERNRYFVYPYLSLSTNNADAGTHYSQKTTLFQSAMLYGKKTSFKLEPNIVYDAFFENEFLYELLKKKKDELCIDYYGEKGNRLNKRYWLTRQRKSYKIISSYSLSNKPYELNIINDNEGLEVFLYDTHEICKNRFVKTKRLFDLYMYNKDISILASIKRTIYIILKKCSIL